MNNRDFQETILINERFFTVLLEDIKTAQSSIDVSTYIYKQDEIGLLLGKALCDAAQRGVRVRLLIDGIGTLFWTGELSSQMEQCGLEVRVYHPLPWMIWQLAKAAHVPARLMEKLTNSLAKINSRNHRKLFIIDNKIVFVSSANVSNCHLPKDQNGEGWRDTTVRLVNADIALLKYAYERSWKRISLFRRRINGFPKQFLDPIFHLNFTHRQRRILNKMLLLRIASAEQRIWITNAYFVPNIFLLRNLIRAARRGVDVRILLPRTGDVLISTVVATTFYTALIKQGVKVYEYLPSMLHAKSIIIDNWFRVGSSNLNSRSFHHDLEVDIVIQTKPAKEILEKQFLIDLSEAQEIDLSYLKKQPVIKKILGRLFLFIRYWI